MVFIDPFLTHLFWFETGAKKDGELHKNRDHGAILVSAGKIFLRLKTPVLLGILAISLDVASLLKKRFKIAIDNTNRMCEYGHIKATTGAAETTARTGGRQDKMTIYTSCSITPAASGFGRWERGEKQTGRETSYADLYDLVMAGELIDLETALADDDFIAAGVEDIRGRIENEPGMIYCVIDEEGYGYPCVLYCGVEEDEVDEDFFE